MSYLKKMRKLFGKPNAKNIEKKKHEDCSGPFKSSFDK